MMRRLRGCFLWLTLYIAAYALLVIFVLVVSVAHLFEAGAALFGNHSHIRAYQLPYSVHDDGNDTAG